MQSAEKHFSEPVPERNKEATKTEKPIIESILLKSPLEEKPYLVLNTPYSRLPQHKVFRSQEGKLYLEKEDRSESKKAEATQEFIVSNSLRAIVKQLNSQEIVVPEIKISPERPGKYYCSFFENLHSLLEQAGTISLRGLFKKRLLKKDFLPLVLTHLVTGDLDRNTSNYGLLVEENKPDKIIVFDFGEIVTQKNMDYLFNIIPAGLTEKDFEKPVEMVKELFSEEYINGLLAKSEIDKTKITIKKKQIKKSLKNINELIKDLIEQKKEEVDNYAEFCRENKKNISSSDKRDKKIQDSLIDDHDFKNIPPDKWKKIEAMINSLRQLREEESRMNQKAEKIECYKDYQDLLKTDNKHSDQHSALFEKYLAEISQFNVSLKDRLFSYYKSI